MLYSAKVMEHFANPHNVGEIPDANGVGEVGNQKCGDIMKIFLKIENGIIEDVKFQTFGCGAAIATSSMATDLIKGKPVADYYRRQGIDPTPIVGNLEEDCHACSCDGSDCSK